MKTTLKIQNCYSWLTSDNQELMTHLWRELRVRELGYEHSRLYKQRIWDGYTDYFKKESGRFLTGLLPEVVDVLDQWNIKCEIIDLRTEVKFEHESVTTDFLHQWIDKDKPLFDLYDYQVDYINKAIKHKRGIVSASTGAGKAQPLDSLVYTPNGPVKMGDLKLGDKVCTPCGKTSKIIGIFPQGEKEVYEISFTNGDKVKCCKEHLWKVKSTSHEISKIVNTQFLMDNIKSKSGKNNFCLQNITNVKFNKKETKIDPYLLGLLLGDGRFHKKIIGMSSADGQIINSIKNIIDESYDLKHDAKYDYYLAKKKRGKKENIYLNAIRFYKLDGVKSENKFIPNDFKYNSTDVRKELIRGLMDTDGTVGKNGQVYLSTSSLNLALDFKEIVESLGSICRITSKLPKFKYKGRTKTGLRAYRVTICNKDCSDFFKLSRKIKKIKIRSTRNTTRVINSIKSIGIQECQCIMIDNKDHLYVTDNCIPTHNTEIMIGILKALPKNCPTLILGNKKSLVEQNYNRLKQWKFENFGRVYDKYFEPNVFTCATVQSLHKIEDLLPHIKCIVVDEVHNMMSKGPKACYNKLKNCSIRIAVSATWEKFGGKDKSQRLSVKGYFGAVLKSSSDMATNGVIKTQKLQERGTLSKSICRFTPVRSPDLPHDIYLDAVTNGIANNWHFHEIVANLVKPLKGRTLILVERLAHGDALKSLIPDAFWIAGKDDLESRQEVIDKLYKSSKEDAIAIVTQGIFNDGIDVHLNNLINAAGGKADHIIIQRIGRGLRPADDKTILNYYDFIFFINEYLLKHSKKRISILKGEGHEIIIEK